MVVGTSAGSVVAAFYAGGADGFQLQKLALAPLTGAQRNAVPDGRRRVSSVAPLPITAARFADGEGGTGDVAR